MDKLRIHMPSFKLESNLDLLEFCSSNPILRFLVNNYLTNIANDPKMMISKMLQKVALTVNKEGCEAAAATTTGICLECAGDEKAGKFLVDSPFLCVITDKSGNELFRGKVEDLGKGNCLECRECSDEEDDE